MSEVNCIEACGSKTNGLEYRSYNGRKTILPLQGVVHFENEKEECAPKNQECRSDKGDLAS